jgi:hypothetical protein
MRTEIDIRGISKAEALVALYNASRSLELGSSENNANVALTVGDAEQILLETGASPSEIHGRIIKIDFFHSRLDPQFFDDANGEGAAARALGPLLASRVFTVNDKRSDRIGRLIRALSSGSDPRKLRRITDIAMRIGRASQFARKH